MRLFGEILHSEFCCRTSVRTNVIRRVLEPSSHAKEVAKAVYFNRCLLLGEIMFLLIDPLVHVVLFRFHNSVKTGIVTSKNFRLLYGIAAAYRVLQRRTLIDDRSLRCLNVDITQ